jgi:hypothetical protein
LSAVLPNDAATPLPAAPQAPAAPAPPVETDAALEARLPTPAERLQQSRDRMARWMIEADGRTIARRRRASGDDGAWSWLGSLRNNPVVALVTDAISSWWANHPLHPAAGLAEGIARDAVAPLARRHPKAMVAGAVVAGALIVWARPWRWLPKLFKPALFTGILSQMASHVIAQVPLDSILGAVGDFVTRHQAKADTDDSPVRPDDLVADGDAFATAPAIEEPADALAAERG